MRPMSAAETLELQQLVRRGDVEGSQGTWQCGARELPGIGGVSLTTDLHQGRPLLTSVMTMAKKKATGIHSRCCGDQAPTAVDAVSPGFHDELSGLLGHSSGNVVSQHRDASD